MVDKVTQYKLSTRPNFQKSHSLKYLEFQATVPNKLNMLREIANSLPEGKRKASIEEIIKYFQDAFTEVLKDWEGLQEGSQLRTTLEDAVGSLIFKEKEIAMLTNIIQKAHDDRRGSIN